MGLGSNGAAAFVEHLLQDKHPAKRFFSSSSQSHKSTNKGGPWSGSNCQVIILSWGSWCGGQSWPSSQRCEFWCWLAILPGCAACVRLLVSLGLNFLVSKMGDITSLGGSNELAMWLCCVTCWAQVRRWL